MIWRGYNHAPVMHAPPPTFTSPFIRSCSCPGFHGNSSNIQIEFPEKSTSIFFFDFKKSPGKSHVRHFKMFESNVDFEP